MDIACPLLDRLEKDGVQEADNGRLVGQVQQVTGFIEFGCDSGEVLPFQLFHNLLCGSGNPRVEMVHRLHGRLGGGYHHVHRHAEEPPDLVEGRQIRGITRCDEQPAVHFPQRQEQVGACERKRYATEKRRVHAAVVDSRYERQTDAGRK